MTSNVGQANPAELQGKVSFRVLITIAPQEGQTSETQALLRGMYNNQKPEHSNKPRSRCSFPSRVPPFISFLYGMDYITKNVGTRQTACIHCEMKTGGRLTGDPNLSPGASWGLQAHLCSFDPPPGTFLTCAARPHCPEQRAIHHVPPRRERFKFQQRSSV